MFKSPYDVSVVLNQILENLMMQFKQMVFYLKTSLNQSVTV